MTYRSNSPRRRAAVAPLMAFLLILMLAMVAFAVDVGYMVVVENELQIAADASALAGVSQCRHPGVAGGSVTDSASSLAVNNGTSEAQKFSLYHQGGGVSLQLLSSDVIVGTYSNGTVTPWTAGSAYPNSVQVTIYRSSRANSPLSLFFGPVLNVPTWSGKATAIARLRPESTINGFNPPSNGPNPLLLPIAIDLNYWKKYLSTGQSPDGVVHDSYTVKTILPSVMPPNNVVAASDGIPELTGVYPDNTSPGNFGLVCTGAPSTDTNTFGNWILNGPSPSDMAYFGSKGLQATASSPATLSGGTGWKSSLVTDLQSIIGQPRILPLFSAYDSNGSNTTYSIVGFVGVTVVEATASGSNEVITFQPTIVVDKTATTTTAAAAATGFVYTSSPLQLVQ